MGNVEEITQWLSEMAVEYGLKLVLALVVHVIGLWIIKAVKGGLRRSFEKNDIIEID